MKLISFLRTVLLVGILLPISCEQAGKTRASLPIETHYSIGTQHFIWQDSTRKDPHYGGNRLVNAQIWYPIEAQSATQESPLAPYMFGGKIVLDQLEGWSSDDLTLVENIPTHALMNVPIKSSHTPYPILLFSPSLGGLLSYYSQYAESFAKSGYVVMGVNHLYESEYVLQADSSFTPYLGTFHDSLESLNIPDQLTGDEFREAKSERSKVLAEDLIFCLNQLAKLNRSSFQTQLDFDKVGVWGHSIGGAAAIYASLLDERFKAVINMDGTPPSPGLEAGIEVPFLFLEDLTAYETHQGYRIQYDRRNNFCQKGSASAYRILIGGIQHNSFWDVLQYTRGNQEESEAHQALLGTLNAYMQAFFQAHLHDQAYSLESIKTDSLEVLIFPDSS